MSYQGRLQLLKLDNREEQAQPEVTERVQDTADYTDLKTEVHRAVIEQLGPRLFRAPTAADGDELQELVVEVVTQCISQSNTPLSVSEKARLVADMADNILGYGPIHEYLRDESVTEVMVNGYDTIYIERKGKIELTKSKFVDELHLERIIDKIVSGIGRRIDESSPMVDARLPDGSRVNAIIKPLAVNGACLTIRKFRRDPFTMKDLINFGTLTPKAAQFLELCVKGKANILVSGGTGSGKTTTLNVISAAIPDDQRIITVEDAAEIQLKQQHVITLEARPENIEGKGEVSIRELVRNCLRMRPDRIIVGEVRGRETVDMLQAMNTGHDGSLTTIHSNNPREAMSRVETLVLTAGVDLPLRAIREQISGAFDLIVQITRLVDGSRVITHITEVGRMEGDTVTLQDIFIALPQEAGEDDGTSRTRLLGPLKMTGIKPSFIDKLETNDVKIPAALFSRDDDAPRPKAQSGHEKRWILSDAKTSERIT